MRAAWRVSIALGWLALGGSGCQTVGQAPDEKSAAPAPFVLSDSDQELLYWISAFGDAIRQVFGVSVNALSNTAVPVAPLPDRQVFRRQLAELDSRRLPCTVCTTAVLACGGTNGQPTAMQSDAHTFVVSTLALHNELARSAPPPGGTTCGELLLRSCTACAATRDPDPPAPPSLASPAQ